MTKIDYKFVLAANMCAKRSSVDFALAGTVIKSKPADTSRLFITSCVPGMKSRNCSPASVKSNVALVRRNQGNGDQER